MFILTCAGTGCVPLLYVKCAELKFVLHMIELARMHASFRFIILCYLFSLALSIKVLVLWPLFLPGSS